MMIPRPRGTQRTESQFTHPLHAAPAIAAVDEAPHHVDHDAGVEMRWLVTLR